MLDIKIFDKELLLVNLYNANTEKEQFDTLTKLSEMVNSIPNVINKNVMEVEVIYIFSLTLHLKLKEEIRP